ncbi:MAG: DUF3108 domain-containing protein [Chitinophagaceae bacterium]|nr:DUF3108 domain-containing protein [Chitinophagaceae bacterium]
MMAQRTDFCGIRNTSSRSGERLTYKVYYTLAGVYVPAGEAIFSNQVEMLQKKPVYHVTGFGRTYSSYDWIYKVRDTYESYIDTTTLLPYQFIRTVNEGGKHDIDRTTFAAGKAVSQTATIKTPDCIQDVLSAIYYARNIDFNQYPIGEKIPFNMYLDDEVFPVYIRYLGKEKLTTKYGQFKVIKFRPLLIEGTLFSGGEHMIVYVTDDQNKLPVFIDTPILVGRIRVYLYGYQQIRNKTTGILSFRKQSN